MRIENSVVAANETKILQEIYIAVHGAETTQPWLELSYQVISLLFISIFGFVIVYLTRTKSTLSTSLCLHVFNWTEPETLNKKMSGIFMIFILPMCP